MRWTKLANSLKINFTDKCIIHGINLHSLHRLAEFYCLVFWGYLLISLTHSLAILYILSGSVESLEFVLGFLFKLRIIYNSILD